MIENFIKIGEYTKPNADLEKRKNEKIL